MTSRRDFIRTAVTAAAGVVGGATAATALTLDAEPAASLAQTYHAAKAACGGNPDAYHQQLLAEAQALLDGRELTDEDRQRLLAAVRCPLCGCGVGGA
jgi:hypothetical protein